jgi:phosphoglycolate phosphatase
MTHALRLDPRRVKLLIFDLDGTLIDSRLDLVHSVNAMLRHFGRHALPAEAIAAMVGDGAPMLVQRALGDPRDHALLKQALEYFLSYYREHKLDHTHVYAGIPEALALLRRSNGAGERTMAVLSNKPVVPSRQIVQALGLASFFMQVYGGNSFSTKKPDPEGALQLMREAGVRPRETVIVGDSSIDVLTGRNAGAWTCGVAYGFAPHTLQAPAPDLLVHSPRELASALA